MSMVSALADYIAAVTGSTLGQNLFIGEAPSSNKVPDAIWWIVEDGGGIISRNATGESLKNYQFSIYYRDRDYGATKSALYTLEEAVNCDGCTQLVGFDTIDIQATTFPIDNDLDREDRKIGLIQLTITNFKEC